jgi:hypothetical protein
MLLALPGSSQQPMVVEAPPPLLQRQLQHYEAWACSLGQKALVQAVPLASVLSALRIVVHGFPEATTADVRQGIDAARIVRAPSPGIDRVLLRAQIPADCLLQVTPASTCTLDSAPPPAGAGDAVQ